MPRATKVTDESKFVHYVSPFSGNSIDSYNDVLQITVMLMALVAFFLQSKLAGWIGIFAAAAHMANYKFRAENKSPVSQVIVAVMALGMVYMQQQRQAES